MIVIGYVVDDPELLVPVTITVYRTVPLASVSSVTAWVVASVVVSPSAVASVCNSVAAAVGTSASVV